MADNTTGLPVQTLSGQFVSTKLVDTGGTNVASVSAAGALKVDGSAVTQPVSGTVAIGATVTPGTGATNLGKAEDAGHTTGDVGVMALAVRNDAGTALAGTDLDYIPLTTDSTGALRVTGSGGTQYAEDAASAGGESMTLAGTIRQDTPAGSTSTDGDYQNLKTDSVGRLWVNGSGVTQPISAASLPLPTGAASAANQTNVQVVDNAGFTDGTTTLGMAGFIFDDVAGTALTENDAAAARIDSKRAQVFVIEDATTRGQKAAVSAAGAVKVDGSAVTQPVSGTVSITANSAVNLAQVAGTNTVTGGVAGTLAVGGVLAHDAAAAAALPVGIGFFASAAAPTDVSADGDAVKAWALRNGSAVVNIASGGTLVTLGQKVMASSLPVVLASDQSNVPTNIVQVSGATQSATNPLFVRLTDGSAAYSAGSSAPTSPQVSTQTSAALGAGASATLNHYVTSGKTGRLAGIDVGATVPLKVVVSTVVTGTPTTRFILFTKPFEVYQWRSPYPTYITRASADATSGFRAVITNMDATVAADVYSTAYFDEV